MMKQRAPLTTLCVAVAITFVAVIVGLAMLFCSVHIKPQKGVPMVELLDNYDIGTMVRHRIFPAEGICWDNWQTSVRHPEPVQSSYASCTTVRDATCEYGERLLCQARAQ